MRNDDPTDNHDNHTHRVAIIGGGASGFFAALRCAEVALKNKTPISVQIYESTPDVLKKVRISGGGRCNVTHHEFNSRAMSLNYPRGQKELLSPFQQFQAKDTVQWFQDRDIELKFEADGRMFPITDSSETIINCFKDECTKLGVEIHTQSKVQKISKLDTGNFCLEFKNDATKEFNKILLATGSSLNGYDLAKSLGHTITDLAPSLFTFKIKHPLLNDLAGISFKHSNLTLKIPDSKVFKQSGPLLITHWGLSGPALLKLSAWAAREMKLCNYKALINVNWMGSTSSSSIKAELEKIQSNSMNNLAINKRPVELTKRFWAQLLLFCNITLRTKWSDVSKKQINLISETLHCTTFNIEGKSRFKEEFVECGGVSLKEINFKTMQSKVCPGLYLAGELIDIDGITGGFNFQNAWTTGWLAGTELPIATLNT